MGNASSSGVSVKPCFSLWCRREHLLALRRVTSLRVITYSCACSQTLVPSYIDMCVGWRISIRKTCGGGKHSQKIEPPLDAARSLCTLPPTFSSPLKAETCCRLLHLPAALSGSVCCQILLCRSYLCWKLLSCGLSCRVWLIDGSYPT